MLILGGGVVGDSKKTEDNEIKEYLSSFPVSRLAPSFELVDLAKEIARADDMLTAQASGKLSLLARQIRELQEEAQNILRETGRNQELHRAECAFPKKAGKIYHLYKKADGSLVFSLLSPEEWGDRLSFIFEGSYRLENDMSWTAVRNEEQ